MRATALDLHTWRLSYPPCTLAASQLKEDLVKQTKIDVDVRTNLSGAQVMGIDAGGMGTVLSILSNMYSDGNLAVVREYASNARDSHAEAGNADPILVMSPSHFDPNLTVQDFGTGLSKDEVLNTYARYGASTKRDTNDQIGCLGIGAKSAFTVGTQFFATAVKDGVQVIALFSLNDDGAPTVNIVSETLTDEPNGVKVKIGVRDVDGVVNAIERLFQTWPRGSVLVDGVEPVSIWDNVSPITDDIHIGWRIDPWDQEDAWTIVMGGIPYPLPQAVIGSLEYRQRVIADNVKNSRAHVYLSVPIGSVDITPSREDLRLTPKTTATMNAMMEKFYSYLGGWVTDQISGASSQIGAIIAHNDLKSRLGNANAHAHAATWNGKIIPANLLDTGWDWFTLKHKRGGGYYGEKVARREHAYRLFPDTGLRKALFVTGVPDRRVRTVQLAAKEFLGQQDAGSLDKIVNVVAVTQFAPHPGDWFDINDPALRTMPFDQFAQYKPARSASSSPRGEVIYGATKDGDHEKLTVKDLKQAGQVYYLTHYERRRLNSNSFIVSGALTGSYVITLTAAQKVEALERRLPGVKSAIFKIQEHADGILASVTQTDLDGLFAYGYERSVPRSIARFLISERGKITNQDVLAAIAEYELAESLAMNKAVRADEIRAAARLTGKSVEELGKSSLDHTRWEKVLRGLPLVSTYFDRDWMRTPEGNAHVILYINLIGQGLAQTQPV